MLNTSEVSEIRRLIDIIDKIIEIASKTNANKNQSLLLSNRISVLKDLLVRLEFSKIKQANAISDTQKWLNKCLKFLKQYKEKFWWQHVIHKGVNEAEFVNHNADLLNYIQFFKEDSESVVKWDKKQEDNALRQDNNDLIAITLQQILKMRSEWHVQLERMYGIKSEDRTKEINDLLDEQKKYIFSKIKNINRTKTNILAIIPLPVPKSAIINFEDLHALELLSKSKNHIVFKGKYIKIIDDDSIIDIAIKKIYKANCKRELFKEINLLQQLKSKHVVSAYGVVVDVCHECLVTEYMNIGSLKKYLQTSQAEITPKVQQKIALDIAKAIMYIHSNGVLHNNITMDNILLTSEQGVLVAKLANFRLAIKEINLGSSLDKKSDIYNYGIILLSILVKQIVQPNNFLEFIDIVAEPYKNFILRCLDNNLSNMPDINEIIKMLEGNVAFNSHMSINSSGDLTKISVREVTNLEYIGEGSFGTVFSADRKTKDGLYEKVAIKELKKEVASDPIFIEEFKEEAKIMSMIDDERIIKVYGIGECENGKSYFIVMEYMPNGSLYKFIHNDQKVISWEKVCCIALDIVYGLKLLHERNIVFRDLKSLNVLLNNDDSAKLTDFGLARLKTATTNYVTKNPNPGPVGTCPWMAPELFRDHVPKYSSKTDIYSFGITLWEIVTRKRPFASAVCEQVIIDAVCSNKREEIPNNCPPIIAKVIQACWDADPDKRPSTDEIIRILEYVLMLFEREKQVSVKILPKELEEREKIVHQEAFWRAEIEHSENVAKIKAKYNNSVKILFSDVNDLIENLLYIEGDTQGSLLSQKIYFAKILKEAYGVILNKVESDAYEEREKIILKMIKKMGFTPGNAGPLSLAMKKEELRQGHENDKLFISEQESQDHEELLSIERSEYLDLFLHLTREQEQIHRNNLFFQEDIARAKLKELATPGLVKVDVDDKLSSDFFNAIISNKQQEVRGLLELEPKLALVAKDLNDNVGRNFSDITGFQYALWALNMPMCNLIKKYMPEHILKKQTELFEKNNTWLREYKESAGMNILIEALEYYIGNYGEMKIDSDKEKAWLAIGKAQLGLSMNILQEYFYPNRPFKITPLFSATDLPIISVDLSELNKNKAIIRGNIQSSPEIITYTTKLDCCRWDKAAMEQLLKERIKQRTALINEILQKNKPSTLLNSRSIRFVFKK